MPQLAEIAMENGPAELGGNDELRRLKGQLHHQLIAGMDISVLGTLDKDQLRAEVRRVADDLCRRCSSLLNRQERERLVSEVLDETFGLGPLEPLLKDPTITDILVNGPSTVYVERRGQLERADVSFNDNRHLLHIIQRIVGPDWARASMKPVRWSTADLADGSRVNAIIPPLALDGAMVSIRRFGVQADPRERSARPQVDHPRDGRTFWPPVCRAGLNVLVSGGTGSGKTTLLNALSAFIPVKERVVTIEDAAELRLQQPHVGRLETRPANVEGIGEITTRDLVRNALRMRPDRIIIGECRGPKALDMLQAMNTGHEGSLTTVHANDTREALWTVWRSWSAWPAGAADLGDSPADRVGDSRRGAGEPICSAGNARSSRFRRCSGWKGTISSCMTFSLSSKPAWTRARSPRDISTRPASAPIAWNVWHRSA